MRCKTWRGKSECKNVNQKKKRKLFSQRKSRKTQPTFLPYSTCNSYIQNGLLPTGFVCTDHPENIRKSWNCLDAEASCKECTKSNEHLLGQFFFSRWLWKEAWTQHNNVAPAKTEIVWSNREKHDIFLSNFPWLSLFMLQKHKSSCPKKNQQIIMIEMVIQCLSD